ncbi:DUF475 domain-containing protein [Salipiger sp. IMCC34102]|uniref:DUF475 domain-containing protein n=1 Tax=Salipiger sp. IMCC34102 TaxID=2510647 RepID=UPI00101BFA7D|nr:DUF475 domain-containing protein [Salipiger sp. IMCC34102]RYH04165.1 DUF475 domain-containing protein [Salipiger sp. IMCC34102]
MQGVTRYFLWSFIVTAVGLVLAAWLGFTMEGGTAGMLSFLLIGALLAVLEISLSFDNAIVNANTLKTMSEVWQRRFLTWGILIAVFGMRLVFPLLIVVLAAGVGPWEALRLAATEPAQYAQIIEGAHLSIVGFGGAFLMMVGLKFFIDAEKDVHWIGVVERPLARLGQYEGIPSAVTLIAILTVATILPGAAVATFLYAAVAGLVTYMAVHVLGSVLDNPAKLATGAAKAGLGAFLYLEVLDASFSFDGVIGAFALTQNLFLIGIGLGIGAMYVRSMTIMLVEKGTLTEFAYLEHGAFWSIVTLSIIMFAQTMVHVPEYVTGLLGAAFIGLALRSSLKARRTIGAHGRAPIKDVGLSRDEPI